MIGRPTLYTETLAKEICDKLSNGLNIADICKADNMPERQVVWRWRCENKIFSDMYDAGMKNKADVKVDLIDDYVKKLERGEIDSSSANVIINTIKWQAAKFYPKMYGDKQIVESKNENLNVNADLPITDADREILARLGWTGD